MIDENNETVEKLSNGNSGQTFTSRISYWSARHRWLIMAASIMVIVGAYLSTAFVGADIRDDDGGVGDLILILDSLREASPEKCAREALYQTRGAEKAKGVRSDDFTFVVVDVL